MSAISGIFNRKNAVDLKLMKKVNNCLSHRGPDGSAIWIEGNMAMGHQMLFTTPESIYEKLPFEKEGLVITADARIDNRKELSSKLEIEDAENIPDSYYILKAYQKWGENCTEKLLGDFVFAIWDKKQGKLFCGRDHMGIKPFYYYLSDDLFLFASEIKALLEIIESEPDVNEKFLAEIMVLIFDDKVNTVYKDIYRLHPACNIVIDSKKHKIEEYWHLDPDLQLNLKSEKDYQERFLEIFTECVRCRLRSAFPVGFELSGGLDSSSVAAVASKINDEEKFDLELHSYSMFFTKPEADETFYAKKVTENKNIEQHFLKGDEWDPIEHIEQVVLHADEPYTPFNNYIIRKIHFDVQKDGNRILLNGVYGDLVLTASFPYLRDLLREHHWIRFLKEFSVIRKGFGIGYLNGIYRFILYPNIPELVKKPFKGKFKKQKQMDELLFDQTSEFAKKTGIHNILNAYNENERKYAQSLNAYHFRSLNDGIISFLMEFNYIMSAEFSLEHRYVFLDKRLVEFLYSLPPEMKIKDGWDKYIIRSSLAGILPEEVRWRRNKTSYANNFYENLYKFQNNKIESKIQENKEELDNYIDTDKIIKLYEQFKTRILFDEYDKHKYNSVMALWGAFILAIWLENLKDDY